MPDIAAFQFHGSSASSAEALVRPETMRSSTSVRYAIGSTPFNFADYAAHRTMPSRFTRRLVTAGFAGHCSA